MAGIKEGADVGGGEAYEDGEAYEVDGLEGAQGQGAEGDYCGDEGNKSCKGLEDGGRFRIKSGMTCFDRLNHRRCRALFVFHHIDNVIQAKTKD